MSSVLVNTELLRELLNAAARTALVHRGSDLECYALGQLEATANLAYVLAAGHGEDDLELLCQHLALDALNRHSELMSHAVPMEQERADVLPVAGRDSLAPASLTGGPHAPDSR